MGASQSQPARARPEDEPRRPTLRRRISTFLRRDQEAQNASKRERSYSGQNGLNSPGPKRRRVDGDDSADVDEPMASSSASSVAGPSRATSARPGLTPFPRGNMSSSGVSTPSSPDTPASPATDELLSDRLRSISTIHDSLAPDWTPQPGIMSRFRRRDSPAMSSAASTSSTGPPPAPARTLSHRLSAIMGFAAPERSPSSTSIPTTSSPAPQPATTPAAADAPPTPEEEGRIPVGAVLVIQGLAQTHANVDETGGQNPQVDLPSLDQQARMIGNLLT